MRTTWIYALIAFAAALVLSVAACPSSPPAGPTVPDAPCDLVSCAAGMALECCPPLAPQPVPRSLLVQAVSGEVIAGWAPDWQGFSGPPGGCMRSTGAGRFVLLPQIHEGDRLLSMTVTMAGNLSADVAVNAMHLKHASGVLVRIGEMAAPNVSDAWSDYVVDLVDTAAVGGSSFWIEVDSDQPGACIGAVRLTYDHP